MMTVCEDGDPCNVECTMTAVVLGDRIPEEVDTRTRNNLAMDPAEEYCFLR